MDIAGILGKIGFDPSTFVITIVNFLIVFFLLKKFFFGKITAALEERQAIIQKGLDDAEKMKHELNIAEGNSDDIIANAKNEANKIVIDAKEKADKLAAEIVKNAELIAADLESKSREKLELERTQMISDIKRQTADLAILATEKIIMTKLDKDADKKIINEYLDTL